MKRRLVGLLLMGIGLEAASAQTVPAEGSWISSGFAEYPVNRSELQGEEIGGKFYTVGGQVEGSGGGPSADMYVYDVAADTWSKGPDMPARRHHVATAKHDGKFYVLGGIDQDLGSWPWDRGETNNWMFDPATSQWTELPPMPERVGAGDAEAVGGRIYVAGGILEGENQAKTRTLEYDIATRTWTRKAEMNAAREHFRMAAIGNRIYAAAGRHNERDVKVFEAYDVATDTWTKLADLPTTRGGVAVQAVNGRIYVMGGEGANASIGLFDDVDEYNPATNTWKKMRDMPIAVHGMAGIAYEGKIWIIAGSNPFGHQPKRFVYQFTPPQYGPISIAPAIGHPNLSLVPESGGLSLILPYAASVEVFFFDALGSGKGRVRTGSLERGAHRIEAIPAGSGFVRAVIDGGAGRRDARTVRIVAEARE
jgi:N-acetylneuraminic acid mutarotase